jgi:hypothetical protein
MAEYHNNRPSAFKSMSRNEYKKIFKRINATGKGQEARRQVFEGEAVKTRGNLRKQDLVKNAKGKIVSIRKRVLALKENPLGKAGYGAKKGHFGTVRLSNMTEAERRKHQEAYDKAGKNYRSLSRSRSRSHKRSGSHKRKSKGGNPGDPPNNKEDDVDEETDVELDGDEDDMVLNDELNVHEEHPPIERQTADNYQRNRLVPGENDDLSDIQTSAQTKAKTGGRRGRRRGKGSRRRGKGSRRRGKGSRRHRRGHRGTFKKFGWW